MQRRKLSKQERQEVWNKMQGHCAYCGCKLEYKDMQADHIRPLHIGGADTVENMYPACRSCNHYKSTFTVEKFREHLSGIHSRLLRDSVTYQIAERFGVVQHVTDRVAFCFEKQEGEINEQESIERAIRHFECMKNDATVVLDSGFGTHPGEIDIVYRNRKLYAELAISALNEIQQYREIGSVEECRAAVEKQKAKKPNYYGNDDDYTIECPNCELDLTEFGECGFDCCPNCGQKLDWSVEE